jgi:7,8-dihydro-6-hydroxymethylpterin-pyrophosphokinase
MGTILIKGSRSGYGVLPKSRRDPSCRGRRQLGSSARGGRRADDTVDYSAVAEAVSRVVKAAVLPARARHASPSVPRRRARHRGQRHRPQAALPVRAWSTTCGVHRAVSSGKRRRLPRDRINLGDRLEHLQQAVDDLARPTASMSGVAGVRDRSLVARTARLSERWWRSTRTAPLLQLARRAHGERIRCPLGPRTIDVDVLLVGDERVDEPDLVVPTPDDERAFVGAPRRPRPGLAHEDLADAASVRPTGLDWRRPRRPAPAPGPNEGARNAEVRAESIATGACPRGSRSRRDDRRRRAGGAG